MTTITFKHSLDHVCEELESEVQVEQAQAEETNTKISQGKPRCIRPIILDFSLITIYMLRLLMH
jgi:hypothetical protein